MQTPDARQSHEIGHAVRDLAVEALDDGAGHPSRLRDVAFKHAVERISSCNSASSAPATADGIGPSLWIDPLDFTASSRLAFGWGTPPGSDGDHRKPHAWAQTATRN